MIKISVIITSYNLEKYIAETFEQLLIQTYQHFEVIIIDDCSTDNTKKIIDTFEPKFEGKLKKKYLKNNLGKPGKVRNVALEFANIKGEYVVFLDGDDIIEPKFLEILLKSAETNQSDIVICAYDRIERKSGHVLCKEMESFDEEILLPPKNDSLAFMNTSVWNKLIKYETIKNIRYPDFSVGEDLCFLWKILFNSRKVNSVNNVLIHYCVHSSSVISNTSEKTIHDFADELAYMLEHYDDKDYLQPLYLATFIHIGISMAVRAYDNVNINKSEYLRWTRNYFKNNFDFFKECQFLKWKSLKKHGIKGIVIWCCLKLYKMNCFRIFLVLFKQYRKIYNKDIRF